MTTKEKMIAALGDLPESASFDAAIERLMFLRGIEVAIQQSEAGDVLSHEDFMRELEEEEKTSNASGCVDS